MPKPTEGIDKECFDYGLEMARAANRAFDKRAGAQTQAERLCFNEAFHSFVMAADALIGREVEGSDTFFASDEDNES